jgi:hypothetical protein
LSTRIDKETAKFAEEMGIPTWSADKENPVAPLKSVAGISKALLDSNPKKALAKLVLRKGIGALANESFSDHAKHASDLSGPPVDALSVCEHLSQKYGDAWHDWEHETLARVLDEEHGVEAGDHAVDLVGSLQSICKTNQPFEDWNIFEKVVHGLNGNIVDFSVIQPCELDHIGYTLHVMKNLRPKHVFENEVLLYIAACAKDAGVVLLPPSIFSGISDLQIKLDELGNDAALKAKVAAAWPRQTNLNSQDVEIEIQLAKLHEIRAYLSQR